ncbi:MAG: hypothetical protein GC199_00115 [Alphaproteobacteria bacterium]|nr:hypothetical protein [Alphaproteobacteria bacterium]
MIRAFVVALLCLTSLSLARAAEAQLDEGGFPTAPFTLTAQADAIAAALEGAGWVSKQSGGPVLYVVGFRSCPACAAFRAGAYDALLAAGADVRFITYARADREGKERSSAPERALVAAVWRDRDYGLWERWHAIDPKTYYETQSLPPSAEDGAGGEAVAASRAFVTQLRERLEANGVTMAVPTLVWRDRQSGALKVFVGYDEETFGLVRESLLGPS